MDATDVLANSFLAVTLANVADWSFVRRGAILWVPESWGRYLYFAWAALVLLIAILALARWISGLATVWTAAPVLLAQQAVSIWMRHQHPATSDS